MIGGDIYYSVWDGGRVKDKVEWEKNIEGVSERSSNTKW